MTITATNLNGYTSSTNYSVTVAGGQNISFGYDADGNLTNEATANSTNEYDWDTENRLVELTQWTNNERLTSQFSYDGFGRRVKIVEATNGVIGSTNQFVWSGTRLCQERDANNTVTRQFFAYGEVNNGLRYFTKDHLGSIREVTGEGGALLARYDYDPYGRRTLVQGWDISDFGFTGYYVHKVSGLQLALFRAYDANLGRFISRDPIGEAGGINLYDYVMNKPISWIDRLGLQDAIDPPVRPEQGFIPGQNGNLGPTNVKPGQQGDAGDIANYEAGHIERPDPNESGSVSGSCPNPYSQSQNYTVVGSYWVNDYNGMGGHWAPIYGPSGPSPSPSIDPQAAYDFSNTSYPVNRNSPPTTVTSQPK